MYVSSTELTAQLSLVWTRLSSHGPSSASDLDFVRRVYYVYLGFLDAFYCERTY
jgi:hypothetical protein